jgi:hypothetical protein
VWAPIRAGSSTAPRDNCAGRLSGHVRAGNRRWTCNRCSFSNPVSPRGLLTCADASRLARCHRAPVSNSCHFQPPRTVGRSLQLHATPAPGARLGSVTSRDASIEAAPSSCVSLPTAQEESAGSARSIIAIDHIAAWRRQFGMVHRAGRGVPQSSRVVGELFHV